MKRTLLFLSALTIGATTLNAQDCSDLFISEYVEGWSNNKAIEIYNPTANAIDLSNYIIARASNGTSVGLVQVNYAVQLTGTIAPYSTHVGAVDLRNPSGTGQTAPIWDSLEARADAFYSPDYNTNSTFYWNGDDAIMLLKGSLSHSSTTPTTNLVDITQPAPLAIVDIFGKVGEDPGTGWTTVSPYLTGSGGVEISKDHSLIRKASVRKGVVDTDIAYFNALAEYDSIPAWTYLMDDNGDTIKGSTSGNPIQFGNWFSLGSHTCDCHVGAVKDITEEQVISIYPNPSTGSFSVKGISEITLIEVYNTLGQSVQRIENNSKSVVSFDLNGNKGVYLLRLTNTEGTQITKRVIVK